MSSSRIRPATGRSYGPLPTVRISSHRSSRWPAAHRRRSGGAGRARAGWRAATSRCWRRRRAVRSTGWGRSTGGCSGGSGSRSATSVAALIRPVASSATRSSTTITAPRATLTSRASSFIRDRNPASTRPRVVVGQRHEEYDDVGGRQQVGQLIDGVDTVAGGAGHAHDLDLERLEPRLDGLPDGAVPDQQDPAVGERRAPLEPPLVLVVGAHEPGDTAQRCQDQGERQLGGGGVVDAAAVAEGDALGHAPPGCCRRPRRGSGRPGGSSSAAGRPRRRWQRRTA